MTENLNGNQGDSDRTAGSAVSEGNGEGRSGATTVVRYGHMGLVGEFNTPPHAKVRCGGKVVIQTDRGIELGEMVNLTCPDCEKPISREQILRYVEACGPEYLRLNGGRVLRNATQADLAEDRHLRDSEKEKIAVCADFINSRGLPMKLVDCEHLFGGERIIFYFMSEGRIDFRDLVRDLAREFQTRIEMRQVGARDEARLVADFETCGRECCCKNFLKTLKPINMKMAKMQKATLDPSKVSGRCGRLKCCLRYEQDTYEELDKRLPRIGIRVRTQFGEGTIIERQILTQMLLILTDDNQRIAVRIDDITATDVPAPKLSPPGEPAGEARGRRDRSARSIPDRRAASQSADEEGKSAGVRPGEEPGVGEQTLKPGDRRGRRRRRGRRGGESARPSDTGGQPESAAEPSGNESNEVE